MLIPISGSKTVRQGVEDLLFDGHGIRLLGEQV